MRTLLAGLLLLTGCSGGTFRLEAPLAASPSLQVSGMRGFDTSACDRDKPPQYRGLRANESATARVGDWSIMAAEPHHELVSAPAFGQRVLNDYGRFLVWYEKAKGAPSSTSDAAAGVPRAAGGSDIDVLLHGVHAALDLPGRIEQTITFSVFAKNGEREVVGVCRSVEGVRMIGSLDSPDVRLACRFVASADHAPRFLQVTGYGSWANFAFKGMLTGQGPAEEAFFTSQNVTVFGTGSIRGFDLRSKAPPEHQIAAIDFYSAVVNEENVARAWISPSLAPAFHDVVSATVALAYVFPWPTNCDSFWIRDRAEQQRRQRYEPIREVRPEKLK